jgi:hypothetical protein
MDAGCPFVRGLAAYVRLRALCLYYCREMQRKRWLSYKFTGNEIGSRSALVYIDTDAVSGFDLAHSVIRCFVSSDGEWFHDPTFEVRHVIVCSDTSRKQTCHPHTIQLLHVHIHHASKPVTHKPFSRCMLQTCQPHTIQSLHVQIHHASKPVTHTPFRFQLRIC